LDLSSYQNFLRTKNKTEGQLALSKRTFIAKQEVKVHHNPPNPPNRAMQQTTTKFSSRKCNAEFLQHPNAKQSNLKATRGTIPTNSKFK
jgi:hypothetical protein